MGLKKKAEWIKSENRRKSGQNNSVETIAQGLGK